MYTVYIWFWPTLLMKDTSDPIITRQGKEREPRVLHQELGLGLRVSG